MPAARHSDKPCNRKVLHCCTRIIYGVDVLLCTSTHSIANSSQNSLVRNDNLDCRYIPFGCRGTNCWFHQYLREGAYQRAYGVCIKINSTFTTSARKLRQQSHCVYSLHFAASDLIVGDRLHRQPGREEPRTSPSSHTYRHRPRRRKINERHRQRHNPRPHCLTERVGAINETIAVSYDGI